MTPKMKKTAKGPSLKPLYIALGVIALGGVGWIAYSVVNGGKSGTATQPATLTGLNDPQALLAAAKPVTTGPVDARVQVLVFSDFTCPSCQYFSQEIEPKLKKEFVETGQVQFKYYDYPIGGEGQHRHSFIAARAARCADEQGKFWEYHDVLFAQQQKWSFAPEPPLEDFKALATATGLDANTFTSCLESDRYQDVITANRMLGETVGVGGTPTVYVGQRPLVEWNRWEAVREAIRRELGQVPPPANK